jgi:hypothetical protein
VDDVLGTVGFVPSALRVRSLSGRRPPAPSQSSPFSAMYATPLDEHAAMRRWTTQAQHAPTATA